MLQKKEIFLLSILFIYYIFIKDYILYLNTIYILVFLYNIYKIYKSTIKNLKKNSLFEFKLIFISIILYFSSYYLIYDPNPIYYLFTFYLPFDNYFKGIFIIIFHSYFINKYSAPKKKIDKFEKKIKIYTDNESEIIQLTNKIENTNYNYNIEYFLSKTIKSFIKNKKKFCRFITFLCIIKVILYFYRTKYWIYFNKKENILPITTSQNTTFYITSCVYNMENIIVDYINEMKKLINYLGANNIIISIVENGDSTDRTRDYLIEFQKYLNKTKIKNKFILTHEIEDLRINSTNKKEKDYNRIKFITKLRNKCFEFLYEIPNLNFDNIKIINFNDVIYTYEDVIKLLSTNKEDYDAVCSLDFYFNLYDTWVGIDINGNSLRRGFPYFVNKEAQDSVINKKPIRIFSCWNGIIIFNGTVFKNRQIKFRLEKIDENSPYKINSYKDHEVPYQSECTYFHIDLQALGYTKRFINSDVRVAYNYVYYYYAKYILPNTFELLYYFVYYFRYFFKKRNKDMSNSISKDVKLSDLMNNWYLFHKLKI